MIQEELNQLAKDIIRNNIYATLSTTDGSTPWSTPVFYCLDDKYNFYFVSQAASLHAKNLLKNPNVAFAIFDSHAQEGKGSGIQAAGSAYLVEKDEELDEALKWYHSTFIEITKEKITGDSPYRLFKIIPERIYVLAPEAKEDKRVEVFLKS